MALEVRKLKDQKEKINKELISSKNNNEIYNLKRNKEQLSKNNTKLNKELNLLKKSHNDLTNKYKNDTIE